MVFFSCGGTEEASRAIEEGEGVVTVLRALRAQPTDSAVAAQACECLGAIAAGVWWCDSTFRFLFFHFLWMLSGAPQIIAGGGYYVVCVVVFYFPIYAFPSFMFVVFLDCLTDSV